MSDLALFDLTEALAANAAAPEPAATVDVNWSALDEWAFCYTATAKGNNSGVRFMCSVADAQKWCSRPESRGMLHGVEWAYFWTSVGRFLRHYNDFTGAQAPPSGLVPEFKYDGTEDNGQWDERLIAAGVTTKIAPKDAYTILEPLGVKVTYAGSRTREEVRNA